MLLFNNSMVLIEDPLQAQWIITKNTSDFPCVEGKILFNK
jgi:hypothetical protein